jgi:hypothetical protein
VDSRERHDDRRAEREARIRKAVQIEEALKWEYVSSGSLWGFVGRCADYR